MSDVKELLSDKDVKGLRHKLLTSTGIFNISKSSLGALFRLRRRTNFASHFFAQLWHNLGSRQAVITESGNLTFAQLSEQALRLADSLHRLGVRQGDYVAVLLHNELAWFQVMAACMLSGIKMPMLNTHLKEQELIDCINSTGAKVLVYADKFGPLIEQNRSRLKQVSTYISTQALPGDDSMLTLNALIKSGKKQLPENGGFGFAQMSFSGGSTGVPKFITQDESETQNKRLKNLSKEELKRLKLKFARGVCRLGMGSVQGNIVSLIPGPLYHAGVQMAVLPLYSGGTVIPMYKFDPEHFLATIEKHQVNWTFVAPTMLERILKLPDAVKHRYALSSMQVVLCAAAPCPDYVKRQINELFRRCGAQVNVFNEYYGSSEAVLISVLRAEDYEAKDKRYSSVGKVVASDCKIYNEDAARWCEPNEQGRVLIRNPRVFRTRYGNSNEIETAFKEVDGQIWYDDGCIGYLDDDEFLYLTSRSKDMIISGGVNIFPLEIENILKLHPDVMDVAVVKVSDADLGEVPGAVIQIRPDSRVESAEILLHCKQNGLYGFKMPRYVEFIEQLPRNTAGKIRKSELESIFRNREPKPLAANA